MCVRIDRYDSLSTHPHILSQHPTHQGRLDAVLGGVEGLGALKLPVFLLLWMVAKTFCVDALALVLALASGVIFGGVLEGG